MCLAESCNCTYKELSKATKLSESTIRYRIDMMNKKYNDPESDYRFKLIDLDRTKRPHVVQLTKYGRLVISAIDPRKTNIKDQKAKIKRVEMAVKVFKSQEELLSSEFKEKCFKS